MSSNGEPVPQGDGDGAGRGSVWFFFVIFCLVIDYARPQHSLNLSMLRPGLVGISALMFFLVFSGRYSEARSRQLTCMWLFVFLLAAHIPFARNNYLAYKTALNQFLYMPFVISVIVCVNSLERLRKLIRISIVISVYVALYALTHNGVGPGNYFSDENDLSLYINMWLPFSYFGLFMEREPLYKMLCLTGLVVGIFSIVVSFSRGGFVGLIAVIVTFMLLSPRKNIALVLIGFFVVLILCFGDTSYWDEVRTITSESSQSMEAMTKDVESESTAVKRLMFWKSAWRMFQDNLLGVGGNNYQVRFPEYQVAYFKRGMWGRVAHSLWFTLIPELGIPGIWIFLLLISYNVKDCYAMRLRDPEQAGGDEKYLHFLGLAFLASLVGFFVPATFVSVLYYAHFWYLTGMIVAAARVSRLPAAAGQEADSV